MSDHRSGENDPREASPEATTAGAPEGFPIPLPPAGSGDGALYPSAPTPGDLPPTGPTPSVGSGLPTPPSGVWTPPPGTGWIPAPPSATPYGVWPGGAGAAPPPPPGWSTPGFAYPVTQPPRPKQRGVLVTAVAAVILVVAIVGGIGLGHVVWPTQNTTDTALSPSGSGSTGGSGASGSSGSGGSATSPFGGGSSGSYPFGSGSSGSGSSGGNSSTGAGAPSDISAIAAKVDPELVDINTNLSYEDEQAAGTGMVLTSNGEILTNNHVIDGATSISVTDVGNGKTYTGTVVGYDRTGDVAVVQLTGASGLQTVSTSTSVSVGEAVVGVGNAGGTGGTPSAAGGSVVAVNQSITASDETGGNSESLTGLIETNAGIQAGDSGGSLVDTSGQVLGMDTAASTNTEDSGTQAYSIPIATALSLARQIEAGKSSSDVHIGATGFLGVSVESSSGSSGDSGGGFGDGGSGFGDGGSGFGDGGSGFGGGGSGSGGSSTSTSGAEVEGTLSGSPAAKAGLVEGDVITGVNGNSVSSSTDLSNLLEPYHPGATVQLQWTDGSGQTHTASVQLESGPPA